MGIQVDTKDCTSLGDAELAEMADLCADGPSGYEIGFLSKAAEAWVLVSMARDGNPLKGFSFCTLERIGGTPSVLIGLASIKRTSKRDAVLRAIMADQMRRALMAFPDEDVLVGMRINDVSGFNALANLTDIIPRPDHRASGEERAWGARLAKRFGVETGDYDDRSFVAKGDKSFPPVLDHETLQPEKIDPAFNEFLAPLDHKRGDSLVIAGWALAENLEKLAR
jgi:hypothetical protein